MQFKTMSILVKVADYVMEISIFGCLSVHKTLPKASCIILTIK